MPSKSLIYRFKSELWKFNGKSAWHFINLPKNLSNKIRQKHEILEEGWGRLKVNTTIEDTSWKTSIWYDTKAGCYLLPIKGVIRKKKKLTVGSIVLVRISIQNDIPKSKASLYYSLKSSSKK